MAQDYLVGAQLDEYHLESLLGRGGMARVYRGVDVNLGRRAAIKVIDLPHQAEAEYVQRFKREAQAISQLDHPHIVRLYRFGEARAGPGADILLYMAMQFIEGASLQYVLDSYRRDGEYIDSLSASRIIREVCSALDYAHAMGVVHRDVKPSNIMLDTQGRAILTDFGLVMLSTQATRGEIFGSPHYIAPEQALSSARAVPQSDLYAVGVILYEMLTGTLPFDAAEPFELGLMHVNNPPPSPRAVRPEISPEVEAVLLKTLEKQPQDRYPSGQALADALDAALAALPEDQRPTIAPARLSIPERVSRGMPGPPPPRPSDAPPGAVPPTVAPLPGPTAPALGQKKNRWLGWAAGLAGLLLLVLCLAGSGVFIYKRFLAGSAVGQPAGALLTGTPAAQSSAAPLVTPTVVTPTQTPTPWGAGPVDYHIEIIRRGEDVGYLLILNSGSVDLPLERLELRAGKGKLDGSAWDVSQLAPGECVLAWKKERKDNRLPEGIACDQVGPVVSINPSNDDLFKDDLEVIFGRKQVGTCDRDQQQCEVIFTE